MYREKIDIRVSNNINRFIDKCINRKIDLLNIRYIDKETIVVSIYMDDLEEIKRINYYSDISVEKVFGISRLILFLKRNLIYFTTVLFCFFIMEFLENIIFEVKVIHSNKEIIELVSDKLEKNGIKTLTFAKSFDNLEKIRLKIIEENPTRLEWLSITRKGMKYIVRVEERIITDKKENSGFCHIVAKKDGMVKKIVSSSGETLVRENDYVRSGDILISGEIHLYEEVKDNVCADGIVFGEVWYNVNLSIPLMYQEKDYTGDSRYNFILNNKKLFKEKYKYYDEKNIYDFNVFGLNFKYLKEKQYDYILKKYSLDEAIEEGLRLVDEKFKIKLKDNGKIKSKKILKKTQFNSKIDIEVFVVIDEVISTTKKYELGDLNGNTEWNISFFKKFMANANVIYYSFMFYKNNWYYF